MDNSEKKALQIKVGGVFNPLDRSPNYEPKKVCITLRSETHGSLPCTFLCRSKRIIDHDNDDK